MKIFISWSGEPSQTFAQVLAGWLPMVIQSVKPFMSTSNIRSGQRWLNEIGRELEDNNFGIICLTPDNKDAPWIHFEAGALSKFVENGAVVPLRIGIENVDMPGPLQQFQAKGVTEGDMRELVGDINSRTQSSLDAQVLRRTFDKFWPELEVAIKSAQKAVEHGAGSRTKRPSDELVEETLNTVRALAGNVEDMKLQLMTRVEQKGALASVAGFGAIPLRTNPVDEERMKSLKRILAKRIAAARPPEPDAAGPDEKADEK